MRELDSCVTAGTQTHAADGMATLNVRRLKIVDASTDCVDTKLFEESSNAENTVSGEFAAPVVVKKLAPSPNGLASTKPDGPNVTFCVGEVAEPPPRLPEASGWRCFMQPDLEPTTS